MTDLPQLTKALAHTRETGGSRVLYRFTLNISGRTHTFDSLLAAEGPQPWTLLTALLGPTHWAHTYPVRTSPDTRTLWAPAFLGEDYRTLLDALGLTGRTGRPWPASQLLDAADYGAISARPRAWIPPQDLPQAARTGIEEEHKTSLFGWTDHVAHPRTGHVTGQNLNKTRRLLGKDIAQHKNNPRTGRKVLTRPPRRVGDARQQRYRLKPSKHTNGKR